MRQLARKHPLFDVTVNWIPGHEGLHGNEEVDKAAKRAAESSTNNSPRELPPKILRHKSLPLSISALLQEHRQSTHMRWTRTWNKSPRFQRINQIDPTSSIAPSSYSPHRSRDVSLAYS
ncbi:hypothetical protein BDR03DRAFT_881231 [Suillus americanus]|nr:hypothetical protein BDR03DRAFT_881231 [Suillus americanus]